MSQFQFIVPGYDRTWISDEQVNDPEWLRGWLAERPGAWEFIQRSEPSLALPDAIRCIADRQNTIPIDPQPITNSQKNGAWHFVGDEQGTDWFLAEWKNGQWQRYRCDGTKITGPFPLADQEAVTHYAPLFEGGSSFFR